ncbi:sigma-70 family RNA polymerase sigma factor [Thalassoglobus sp. JC818]|uniref:sigma-70 family RNA polymerase sigma factor n=1 Tax=Thalassoglobus sp. JC818 TaxID=3232136 RepID=UPI003459E7D6
MKIDAQCDHESDNANRRNLKEHVEIVPARRRLRKRRNYWARIDPKELVTLPDFEPLSYLQEVRLIQRAQQGDLTARNEIWVRNVRLVLSTVNSFHVPQMILPDAIQVGIVGLARAIEKYEVERYNAFSTYAWYWVFQGIARFLQESKFFVRIPTYKWKQVHSSLHGPDRERIEESDPAQARLNRIVRPEPLHEIPAHQVPTYSDSSIGRFGEEEERSRLITRVRKLLSKREYFVLKHRFGLEGVPARTLEQIGDRLEVTRERVRQIESAAIRRLQSALVDPAGLPQTESTPTPENQSEDLKQSKNFALDPLPLEFSTLHNLDRADAQLVSFDVDSGSAHAELLLIFKPFTFRQANAVIHYYGLMGHQPLPIEEVAELLELTSRKTKLALLRGRKRLLFTLRNPAYEKFWKLRNLLESDVPSRDIQASQGNRHEGSCIVSFHQT